MNKKGFTLVEVLIVVLIIGILSAIAVPQYRRIVTRSRFSRAQVMAKSIYDSAERQLAVFGKEEWAELPAEKQKIGSLDIIGGLPTGASVSSTAITLNGFEYSWNGTVVTIKAVSGTANGAVIAYNGESFTCVNTAKRDICDIYGVD